MIKANVCYLIIAWAGSDLPFQQEIRICLVNYVMALDYAKEPVVARAIMAQGPDRAALVMARDGARGAMAQG